MSSYKKVYSDQFNVKNINYANALNFLTKIYKKLNYIDFYKDYDTKLLLFLEDDFTNNELLFLRNGINELHQAKIFLDNYQPKNKEYFYNEIYNQYVAKTNEITFDKKSLSEEEFLKYVNSSSERQEKTENELVNNSKELIKTELLIFKSKIERFGYIIQFKDDLVHIFNTKENDGLNSLIKNTNFDTIENNYPFLKNISNKAKIVLVEILIKKASLVDVVDCIDNNSNIETKQLLVDELINTYRLISNEFMFKVNEADITDALETNSNNLEYVFIGEGDYPKIQAFVRDINGYRTVYNVDGLLKVEFENSIKLVLLNNLMIDYFNGFFANEIEGFENISHYKYINKYLLEKYRESKNIENLQETEKNIIVEDNNYERSTIEDYLEQFKELIINNTYESFIHAYLQYFKKGNFPVLNKKIIFKRMNKKRLGWELKELYKSLKTDNLDIDFFRFAQQNINLFEKEIIVEVNFNKSKFYKAFTTNPNK